jgi:tetratricopeptide (TPR) repeat protein
MNAYLIVLIVSFAGQLFAAQVSEESVADSLRKYRFLARTARDKQEYTDAIRYYREQLRYQPEDFRIYYRIGEMQLAAQEPIAARESFNQLVTLDSLHVNANIFLYNLYINDSQADSAALAMERVLQARPEDADKRRTLADLYRREGRLEQAIGHYKVLIHQGVEAEASIELVALLYEDLGETSMALQWRRRLAVLGDPQASISDQREMLETIIRLQLETGEVESAAETLLELAHLDTANRYSYYSRIVSLADNNDDVRLQLTGWEGMVQANPRDLETVAKLVEWYLNQNQLPAADRWLKRGLDVQADNAHLQLLKGDLLLRREDEAGALAAFEKARNDVRWETIAQQRIWQLRPPETEEEKLRRAFFGRKSEEEN